MSNQHRFSGKWETKWLGDIAAIRNQKVLSTNVDPNTLCVELEHLGSGNGQLLERATAETSTSSKYRFCAALVMFFSVDFVRIFGNSGLLIKMESVRLRYGR